MIGLIPTPSKKPPPAGTTLLAVSPTNSRRYADRDTQTALDMWELGAAYVARTIYGIQAGAEALRERISQLAGFK
jgi:hypothetical protein